MPPAPKGTLSGSNIQWMLASAEFFVGSPLRCQFPAAPRHRLGALAHRLGGDALACSDKLIATVATMKTGRKEFPRDREWVWVETNDGICERATFCAKAMQFEREAQAPIPAEVTMAWERHYPRSQGRLT